MCLWNEQSRRLWSLDTSWEVLWLQTLPLRTCQESHGAAVLRDAGIGADGFLKKMDVLHADLSNQPQG